MPKKFPMDCPDDCPHYYRWDLSTDDYTNICNKLGVQVDDMDAYGAFYVPLDCPLDTTKEGERMKTVKDIINAITKIDSLCFPPDESYDFENKTVTFSYSQFEDIRTLLWDYKAMLLAIKIIDVKYKTESEEED